MNRRNSIILLVAIAAAATIPATDALAHRIGIFATYDGEMVVGEVYLSGGGRPANCVVRVEDGITEPLEVKTNEKAEFRFKPRTTKDQLLIVDTGDGHRAEFRIPAAELAGATIEAESENSEPAPSLQTSDAESKEISATESPSDLDRRVAKAVAKEIAKLRLHLDQQDRKERLRDIIGAIGYIFGIAGILMMLKARSRCTPREK